MSSVDAPESARTVTVPNIAIYVPVNASIRQAFGSTWTSFGLRNRPDWSRTDVVFSPDIRVIRASAKSNDGTSLMLVPALFRATLQVRGKQSAVKLAIFAEGGLVGAYTTAGKSRFTAAPATGLGVSISQNRLDIEAQYIQSLSQDGRDLTGFCIGFGYRL
jgi:hypothetical protein